MTVGAIAAFRSTVFDSILRRFTALPPVSSSFEWHHFVDRSALFTSRFFDTAPSWRQSKTSSPNLLFFSEEHVDGSSEEFYSLVPARVQQ
jgi:hypothetical protein